MILLLTMQRVKRNDRIYESAYNYVINVPDCPFTFELVLTQQNLHIFETPKLSYYDNKHA